MLLQLAIDSLTKPRASARRVLALEVAPATLVEAAVATACIGLLLGFVGLVLSDGSLDRVSAAVLSMPLLGAAVQFGVMAAIAGLTFRIGRMFGGTGGFWGALTVVVWLNAVTLGIQLAQLAALALAPPLAGVIAIVTLFWLMWAYANFVAELHGFGSPVMVLGVMILTGVAIAFALTILASMFGLAPQGT